MQLKTQDVINRITAVQAFSEGAWKSQWAGVPMVATLLTTLAAQETAIQSAAQSQNANASQSSGHVVRLNGLREAVRHDLEDFHRDAVVLAIASPGLEKQFEIPGSGGDQGLLGAARLFIANATPIKADFLALGMPANFLQDLADDLDAFETLLNDKDAARQASSGALRTLDEAIRASAQTIDTLNAIFQKVLDASALAGWMTAKRFDTIRAHRRKLAPIPPTP